MAHCIYVSRPEERQTENKEVMFQDNKQVSAIMVLCFWIEGVKVTGCVYFGVCEQTLWDTVLSQFCHWGAIEVTRSPGTDRMTSWSVCVERIQKATGVFFLPFRQWDAETLSFNELISQWTDGILCSWVQLLGCLADLYFESLLSECKCQEGVVGNDYRLEALRHFTQVHILNV